VDGIIGGYPRKAVSLFWGDTGSLKTTFAGYIPIIRLFDEKKKDQVFVEVDLEGGFDFDRLYEMAASAGIDIDVLESRIMLFEPTTFDAQSTLINRQFLGLDQTRGLLSPFDGEYKGKNEKDGTEIWEMRKKPLIPSLISVDSIVWLAKLELGQAPRNLRPVKTGEYVNDIGIQLASLRSLAVRYDCPVTVTSWDSSSMKIREKAGDDEEGGPSGMGATKEFPFLGGRNLAFIPKMNVMLVNPNESDDPDLRMVTVWKHRCKPRLRYVFVKVTNEGVIDVEQEPEQPAEE